jgi:hypothetical protein
VRLLGILHGIFNSQVFSVVFTEAKVAVDKIVPDYGA